jgi:GWxTD domain-containing protein
MKKFGLTFCVYCLFSLSLFAGSTQAKKSAKDLEPRFRKWLEEEVVYIITPKEKEVFLQLETDRQREMFIEAFWKHRDPTPSTPENEFKIEHYRRIKYANDYFGKSSPGAGWRSDQGRIYIILGAPNQEEKFENLGDVYPTVIWFYNGMIEYGLPNAFYVVFFKKDGVGEYELYSPVKFGPQYLMPNFRGDMTDYQTAYDQLFDVEPNIAYVSLSLIEGESLLTVAPSIASEALIYQKIPLAPQVKVKDAYAEKLLAYKDVIDVDYTANYIDNDSLVRVFQDPAGQFYVHYLIEPARLSFEQYENRYLSNLEVNGTVNDLQGDMIYQFERKTPVEMNEAQIASIRSKFFSFQDMFPLLTGRYKLSLLFKNTVSKEFTSLETDLVIPETSGLQMSPLTLANRIDKGSKYIGQNKPFLAGNYQLVPSPRNDFTSKDTLSIFFQIRGLDNDLRQSGILECAIMREGAKVRSLVRRLSEYADPLNILEEFPLADLAPANYEISVSVLDQGQVVKLSEKDQFYISYMAALPRPWVLSLPKPPDDDAETINILGNQYLNKKDLARARALLEQAHHKDPASPAFALDYCRILFQSKEFQSVKDVALPFLREKQRDEFLELLGQSSQALGQLAEAIGFYKEYLTRLGTNLNILNSVGDCYAQLGNVQEALLAYEKSLQVNPNQEKIKALIKTLKEKK